jgi:hypothetical protein
MKHIKKFNENSSNDAIYAIADSFNKVKEELALLNKRLGWSTGKSEELDEIGSEIEQMNFNFDELLTKFNNFDNNFFGR